MRRTQSEFPAVDAHALDGYRKEQIRVVEIVVIEKVGCASEEVIRVDGPASEGNGYAELMFFVALSMKRSKSKILVGCRLQERAGKRQEGRRLIKVAVKPAKNPVQLRNAQGCPDSRACSIFDYVPREMSLPKARVPCKPGSDSELIFGV